MQDLTVRPTSNSAHPPLQLKNELGGGVGSMAWKPKHTWINLCSNWRCRMILGLLSGILPNGPKSYIICQMEFVGPIPALHLMRFAGVGPTQSTAVGNLRVVTTTLTEYRQICTPKNVHAIVSLHTPPNKDVCGGSTRMRRQPPKMKNVLYIAVMTLFWYPFHIAWRLLSK